MRIPKLLEVFHLSEANVTSLSQMNKIPLWAAEEVNNFNREFADVITKLLAKYHRPFWDGNGSQAEKNFPRQVPTNFLNFFGPAIVVILSHSRSAKKAEVVAKLAKIFDPSHDDEVVNDELIKLSAEVVTIDPDKLRRRAILKFPDGFFWVKLEKNECDIEGRDMQHCGKGWGDLYSLRDQNAKPHATMDVTRSTQGKPEAGQIRGKQNATPDRKYWDYIKKFVEHMKIDSVNDSHPEEFLQYIDVRRKDRMALINNADHLTEQDIKDMLFEEYGAFIAKRIWDWYVAEIKGPVTMEKIRDIYAPIYTISQAPVSFRKWLPRVFYLNVP